MFEDLRDSVSFLWSWRWPYTEDQVTAADIERIKRSRGVARIRLAIAYEFSVGDDGPYTGESFWEPLFFPRKRVAAARHKFHLRRSVIVHYRVDDPSVNRLDRSVWKGL
jgi:hypothetical protein